MCVKLYTSRSFFLTQRGLCLSGWPSAHPLSALSRQRQRRKSAGWHSSCGSPLVRSPAVHLCSVRTPLHRLSHHLPQRRQWLWARSHFVSTLRIPDRCYQRGNFTVGNLSARLQDRPRSRAIMTGARVGGRSDTAISAIACMLSVPLVGEAARRKEIEDRISSGASCQKSGSVAKMKPAL